MQAVGHNASVVGRRAKAQLYSRIRDGFDGIALNAEVRCNPAGALAAKCVSLDVDPLHGV